MEMNKSTVIRNSPCRTITNNQVWKKKYPRQLKIYTILPCPIIGHIDIGTVNPNKTISCRFVLQTKWDILEVWFQHNKKLPRTQQKNIYFAKPSKKKKTFYINSAMRLNGLGLARPANALSSFIWEKEIYYRPAMPVTKWFDLLYLQFSFL